MNMLADDSWWLACSAVVEKIPESSEFDENYKVAAEDECVAAMSASWRHKFPLSWSTDNVLAWIYDVAHANSAVQLEQVRGENFQDLAGPELCTMPETDFVSRDHIHGRLLYGYLQALLASWCSAADCSRVVAGQSTANEPDFNTDRSLEAALCRTSSVNKHNTTTTVDELINEALAWIDVWDNNINDSDRVDEHSPTLSAEFFESGYDSVGSKSPVTDIDDEFLFRTNTSPPPCLTTSFCHQDTANLPEPELVNLAAPSTLTSSVTVTPRKRRRTSRVERRRTSSSSSGDVTNHVTQSRRSRIKTRVVHLWQFMRSLLASGDYNPSHVKWENQSAGVFRIVKSAEVARLWGVKKKNLSMNFEKMSRSLRWCREHGFFADVPKTGQYPKKLCFRFGELAVDGLPVAAVDNQQPVRQLDTVAALTGPLTAASPLNAYIAAAQPQLC